MWLVVRYTEGKVDWRVWQRIMPKEVTPGRDSNKNEKSRRKRAMRATVLPVPDSSISRPRGSKS